MTREDEIQAFLKATGWGDAERTPIASDMSYRSYEQLFLNGREVLMMNAPPDRGEDCRPYVAICNYLRSRGFSAPELFDMDLEKGFVLLERFDGNVLAREIEQGGDEATLYHLAVDNLIDLHQDRAPEVLPVPGERDHAVRQYSHALMKKEVTVFAEWFFPTHTGRPTDADLLEEFYGIWEALYGFCDPATPVLVHWDYHAENLFHLRKRKGNAALGMIDFQDAVQGHQAYDLVCLLEDARRDVGPDLAAAMKKKYLEHTDLNEEEFERAYAVIGAQKNLKIFGVFTRYWLRRGGSQYLKLIPRVFRHLEHDLKHPALADLKKFMDHHVSEDWRYGEPDLSKRDALLKITGSLEDHDL